MTAQYLPVNLGKQLNKQTKKKFSVNLQVLWGKDFDKMEMDSFQVIKNHFQFSKLISHLRKKIGLFGFF